MLRNLAFACVAALLVASGGAHRASAQTMTAPSYPTPLPAATPFTLQSVQLLTLPSLTRSSAGTLSRYERKAAIVVTPNLGNEAILVGSPADVYAQTTALYARRSAQSQAILLSARGILSVPLRKSVTR